MDVIRRLANRVAVMENGRIMEELNLDNRTIPTTKIGKILLKHESEEVKVSV